MAQESLSNVEFGKCFQVTGVDAKTNEDFKKEQMETLGQEWNPITCKAAGFNFLKIQHIKTNDSYTMSEWSDKKSKKTYKKDAYHLIEDKFCI